MNNSEEYTKFKSKLASQLITDVGVPTSVSVVDDDEYMNFCIDEIETPQTCITKLYGYYASKGKNDDAWDAMYSKALDELTIYPVMEDLSGALKDIGYTKDDLLPMVFPKVVNSHYNADLIDGIVHRNILDVAFCYTAALVKRPDGFPVISAYLNKDCLSAFDIFEEDLYEAALINLNTIGFISSKTNSGAMFLTTEMPSFPASTLTYIKGGLDNALQQMSVDKAYVLQLSDKISMLIPTKGADSTDLKKSLRVKHGKVWKGDIVSDEVYLYEKGCLKIVR